MGKTFYKHRPDEDKVHVKNASRHGHAKYKRVEEESKRLPKRLRLTQDWVDWATDQEQDDDPNTIP